MQFCGRHMQKPEMEMCFYSDFDTHWLQIGANQWDGKHAALPILGAFQFRE